MLETGLVAVAWIVAIVLAIIDARTRRLPTIGIAVGLVLVLVASVLNETWQTRIAGGLVGIMIVWLFAVRGKALYGRTVLGWGDVRYSVLIGALVGWPLVLAALLVAAITGGIVAIGLLAGGRSLQSTFPYGPCLAFGAAVVALVAGFR